MKKITRSITIPYAEAENGFDESDLENNENDDSCNERSTRSRNGISSSIKKQKISIKTSPQSINDNSFRSTRSRGNTNSNQNQANHNERANNNSSPQSIIYVSDSDITNHSEDFSFKNNNNVYIYLEIKFGLLFSP